MKKRSTVLTTGFLAILLLGILITPGVSHHSFAMYDQNKVMAFTGVETRYVAQANHAELHFVPLGSDGKPMRGADGKYINWGIEMAGAAAVAAQGISISNFPTGTIFSVNLNPLRDGKTFGRMVGPIYKCP